MYKDACSLECVALWLLFNLSVSSAVFLFYQKMENRTKLRIMLFLYILQVQEWFKNRRKKDKLIKQRMHGYKPPTGRRGRKPHMPHSIAQSVQSDNNTLETDLEIALQVTTQNN